MAMTREEFMMWLNTNFPAWASNRERSLANWLFALEEFRRSTVDHCQESGGQMRYMLVPETIWTQILDHLDSHSDVRDGADGPRPNDAMAIQMELQEVFIRSIEE